MSAPVQQLSWVIAPNQRIPILTYTTLVLQGGRYLKIIADTLLANGYTCKGSSNGAAAAMDGVNRWTTDGAASVQGANTTSAQSWMVLTDGNGCDLCLAFVGATGDIQRISYSPSGVFVAAGTPTFTPTATDEQVLFTGVSLITNSTVNDRVVHVWVDSEARSMRTITYVAGALSNGTWGVERVNNNRTLITFSPAVWGFAFNNTNLDLTSGAFFAAYSANTRGGLTRISSATVNIFCGAEAFANASFVAFNGSTRSELQRGVGQAMWPILIGSTTAQRQGPIANLYDWWTSGNGNAIGGMSVVFPGGRWVQINVGGSSGGPAWPWDGATQPQTA